MAIEPADLTRSPSTMAFSKIRGIARQSEAQVLEFFNGLYRTAVQARESGDWTSVDAFVQLWEDKLTGRSAPDALRFDDSPWTPFGRQLRKAKVALISTGGVYIKDQQEPYNTDGDTSYRIIPKDTPKECIGVAHTHYDTSGAVRDINVIFPYERMKEMESQGIIGSFADTCYGFMGFIPRTMMPGLLDDSAPEVAGMLKDDGVDAVLIGTT